LAAGEKANKKSEGEATYMRPPGNAAETLSSRAEAHGAIEKLEKKPNAQKQNGRQNKCRPEDERGHECFDAGERIKAEVRAHDSRNGSAGTNGWDLRTGIGKDVHARRRDPASQIQEDISRATKAVFNVVAKNPERPHIAEEMKPTTVQKHGAKKSEYFLRGRIEMADLRIRVNCGDNSETPEQIFQVRAQP
jgi:hypothetical protein